MELSHVSLDNAWVKLEPLHKRHKAELRAAIGEPLDTLKYSPSLPLYRDGYEAWVDWQIAEGAAGRWLPYAVVVDGRAVGQSSYINLRAYDAGVEIGGTWYAQSLRGGPVNPSCKLLLLEHAFACGAERVELKTDADNAHSRAAILKLGATFEGVHRRHMRRPWGGWRDTAWFSILSEEWPSVRERLEARLAAFA